MPRQFSYLAVYSLYWQFRPDISPVLCKKSAVSQERQDSAWLLRNCNKPLLPHPLLRMIFHCDRGGGEQQGVYRAGFPQLCICSNPLAAPRCILKLCNRFSVYNVTERGHGEGLNGGHNSFVQGSNWKNVLYVCTCWLLMDFMVEEGVAVVFEYFSCYHVCRLLIGGLVLDCWLTGLIHSLSTDVMFYRMLVDTFVLF